MTPTSRLLFMSELQQRLDKLFLEKKFYEIIDLLENQDLDYARTLFLVRTYLNASLKTNDPVSLTTKAQNLLDAFAIEGKDDPNWLYLKGAALFQENLIPDALMRLQRAISKVTIGDPLFNQVKALMDSCQSMMIEAEFRGLDLKNKEKVGRHIEENFGKGSLLCTLFSVEVIHIPPTEKHPYNLLVTKGLSAKTLNVPQGYDEKLNSHLELCIALPEDYRFTQDREVDWPVYLLLDMIRHVIGSLNFIGFGYYLRQDPSISKATAYNGVMLTALGEYPGEAQSMMLTDNSLVRFYQLIPLQPMETLYREHHSAMDLLLLFKEQRIRLTPFIAARPDVCCGPTSLNV